jgi:hypothetical protein
LSMENLQTENGHTDENFPAITPYPFEAIPSQLCAAIETISRSHHIEPEIVASIMTGFLTGAIGNTLRVSPREGWSVPLFTWHIIVAETGRGKSPVINTLIERINALQGDAYREYSKKLREYENDLRRVKLKIRIPDKPKLKHYTLSDTTVEGMVKVFKDDPRGVILHRDEIAGLILGLNQYKAKGRGNDRQRLIELFDCKPWKIDRKESVVFIPNTGASIVGGIQPRIIPAIFENNSFDDGLIPRFLFSVSEQNNVVFQREGVSRDVIELWNGLLAFCYGIPLNVRENGESGESELAPYILKFNDDALNGFEKYYNDLHRIEPFQPYRIRTFISKTITYCLKFAGLLHVINAYPQHDRIYNTAINEKMIRDAVSLAMYYLGQASRIMKLYDRSEQDIDELTRKLVETLHELAGDTKEGRLSLETIRTAFNEKLPDQAKVSHNKRIGTMLSGLGLCTEKGTGGKYILLWEPEKIEKLFLRTKSTLSTLSEKV